MYLKYKIHFVSNESTKYMQCILNTYFKYLYFKYFTTLHIIVYLWVASSWDMLGPCQCGSIAHEFPGLPLILSDSPDGATSAFTIVYKAAAHMLLAFCLTVAILLDVGSCFACVKRIQSELPLFVAAQCRVLLYSIASVLEIIINVLYDSMSPFLTFSGIHLVNESALTQKSDP